MRKVALPKFPVTGGCQCGSIRYLLKRPPVTFYICHRTECQKQSSSAFGQSMRVRTDDVEIVGNMARYARSTSSGDTLECEFCPKCGSRLFHKREVYDAEMNIKAGSLDDASWLRPAGHIWTGSKQQWVTLHADDLAYEGQPSDYGALKERWQEMVS